MGFDVDGQREGNQAATTPDTPAPVGKTPVGKTTVAATADATPTTDTPTPTPADAEQRIRALAAQLERELARKPAVARQAAAKLSAEFPALFTPEWLVGILRQIDLAARKKQLIDQAKRDWDDRPASARAALGELMRSAPRDAKLRAWCTGFLKKIDVFQESLLLEQTFHTRPGEAQAHARRLHALQPAKFTTAWLTKVSTGIWQFQDAAWAKKVSSDELGAWLGSNAIDWEEAPDAVKQELAILLGRMKRDQAFRPGGGGAKTTRTLAAPTSDTQRLAVLDQADNVSTDFTFTRPQDIPAKRLEVGATQETKEAAALRGIVATNQPQPTGGGLLSTPGNPMLALLNQTLEQRARDLDRASAANQALAQRLRSGQTTLDQERQKLMADIRALEWEAGRRRDQAAELEKAGNTEGANQLRATIAALDQNAALLDKVIADPQGILPGAGKFDFVWGNHPSMSAPGREQQDINRFNSWVDKVTIGDDPTQQSVGRRINELVVGLERFTGRLQLVQSGVTRLLADAGSYFLPDSVTAPIRDYSQTLLRSASALKNAQSQVTSNNAEARIRWEKTIGELPLLESAFSNEKLAESPDNALFAVLGAMPQTKGIAVVAQFATSTGEAFFSTYGTTGNLKASLGAAGWAVLQNLAGLGLAKIGLGGAGGALAGNIALVYGIGTLRGQTRQQIEEQMLMTLIGAGIGAATGAATGGGFQGIREKTSELVSTLEGQPEKPVVDAAEATPGNKPDPAHLEKVDRVATELATSLAKSREIVTTIANGKAQNSAKLTTELAQVNKVSAQKRAELEKLFAEERARNGGAATVGSSTLAITTTDAAVTTRTVPAKPTTTTTTTAAQPTGKLATEPVVETKAPTVEVKAEPDAAVSDPAVAFKQMFDAPVGAEDALSPMSSYNALARKAAAAKAANPELVPIPDVELIALIGYTTSDAMAINQGLRGQLGPGATRQAKVYADLAEAALAKLPDRAGTFTRMTTYSPEILAQFVEGTVVVEPGFSSTSAGSAGGLAEVGLTGNTELVIQGKRGKAVDMVSNRAVEAEVLFAPKTAFRVESVTTVGERTRIVLTEVEATSGATVIGKVGSPAPTPAPTPTPSTPKVSVDELIARKIALRGEAWGNNIEEGTCAHVAMRNAVSARINGLEALVLNISGLTNLGQWLSRFGLDPAGRIGRGLARLGYPTRGGHAIAAVRGVDGVWRFISWGQIELDWQTYSKRVFGPTGQLDGTFRLEDYVKWMVDNVNLHNEPKGTSPLLAEEAEKARQEAAVKQPERAPPGGTIKIGWLSQ